MKHYLYQPFRITCDIVYAILFLHCSNRYSFQHDLANEDSPAASYKGSGNGGYYQFATYIGSKGVCTSEHRQDMERDKHEQSNSPSYKYDSSRASNRHGKGMFK